MVEPMMIVDHAELQQRIMQCERIDEFEQVYDSAAFQRTLRTIRVAQGVAPVDEWSKDWAMRMRAEAAADLERNECRHTALTFVYELCNRWKDDECEGVTDESLVKEFKGHRLINILQLVLPMDRAQALYKMIYPGKAVSCRAIHWLHTVSERPFWSTVDGEEQIKAALAKVRRYLSATARDGTMADSPGVNAVGNRNHRSQFCPHATRDRV
jgi:hypothetical protein